MGRKKIGLALGSGSSRGWAHIGVLKALGSLGIVPEVISGTSVGALVGAAFLTGRLEALEDWALSLRKVDTLRYMTLDLSWSGVVNTEKVDRFLSEKICTPQQRIEDLPGKFSAVAADLVTGREVRMDSGPLQSALRSSMAFPGLFPAVRRDGIWLVDGGAVNPVPVSQCRMSGADLVIAVNLNDSLVGRHFPKNQGKSPPVFPLAGLLTRGKDPGPTMFDTMAGSLNIMQDWITRTRLAMEPADLVLTPRLPELGLMDIHKAREALEEGLRTVEVAAPLIMEMWEDREE